MNKNNYNYIINLLVIVMLYILLIPVFELMFSPLIKFFINNHLSIKLVVYEIIKFSLINVILMKIKNEKVKKIIIFSSMFIYTLGYNMLMFILTILFQKNIEELNYKRIIYLYISIIFVMLTYKYRMMLNVSFLEMNYHISRKFFITVLLIDYIWLKMYKKKNINLDLSISIINILIIGIIAYIPMVVSYIPIVEFSEFTIIEEIFNTSSNPFHSSIVTIMIIFIFYYYNISVYEDKVKLLLYILLLYFMFVYTIGIYYFPNYITQIFIIFYTIYLLYDKKFKKYIIR